MQFPSKYHLSDTCQHGQVKNSSQFCRNWAIHSEISNRGYILRKGTCHSKLRQKAHDSWAISTSNRYSSAKTEITFLGTKCKGLVSI